jgi:hypothetical protein
MRISDILQKKETIFSCEIFSLNIGAKLEHAF